MKCCIEVGIKPKEDSTYQIYYESKKGFIKNTIKQVPQSDEAISVGEVAAELDLTSRPADASDEEEDASDLSEDEEEEEDNE